MEEARVGEERCSKRADMQFSQSALIPRYRDEGHDRVCLKGHVMLNHALSSFFLEAVGSPAVGWAVRAGIFATSWYQLLRLRTSFAGVNSPVEIR